MEHRISSLHSQFLVQLSGGSLFLPTGKTRNAYDCFIIKECGSTLNVGLQHAVPPTTTKLNSLLLPTQEGTKKKKDNPSSNNTTRLIVPQQLMSHAGEWF